MGVLRGWLGRMMAVVTLVAAETALSQEGSVSVGFLRAALGSISDRASVSVLGEYSGADGLVDARGTYLRNKGFSRFTIREPHTGVTFGSVYCAHNSPVFNELLGVKGTERFVFQGVKGRGEHKEDAVFVTSLRVVRGPAAPASVETAPQRFTITIIEQATSNRTVMVNVELGKPVNLLGATLMVEEEEQVLDPVRVLR